MALSSLSPPASSGRPSPTQRLRQGCQKLSATVSLRSEGEVNSTMAYGRSSGRGKDARVEESANKKNGEREERDREYVFEVVA